MRGRGRGKGRGGSECRGRGLGEGPEGQTEFKGTKKEPPRQSRINWAQEKAKGGPGAQKEIKRGQEDPNLERPTGSPTCANEYGSLLRRLGLLRRLMMTPMRITETSYAQYCAWYTTLHQVLLPHILLPTHTPSPTVTVMFTCTIHA